MQHVAIDLSGKEPWICVRSETGEILEERPHRTASLPLLTPVRPGPTSTDLTRTRV